MFLKHDMSTARNFHLEEVEDQTNDLLGGSLVGLNFVPVQQSNGSDCGVFA